MPPEVTVFREQLGRRHKHQRKNLESMGEQRHLRRKPLPAIHFSGDTSRYVYGQHENYNGNFAFYSFDVILTKLVSVFGWAHAVISGKNYVGVRKPKQSLYFLKRSS